MWMTGSRRNGSWGSLVKGLRPAPRSAAHHLFPLFFDGMGGVSSVDNQPGVADDEIIVVAGVVSGDQHGVIALEGLRCRLNRRELEVVLAHLVETREIRIVV